jgi:hypothetical protein
MADLRCITDDEAAQLEQSMNRMVLFFDKTVLAQYRSESQKYKLTVSEFDGELELAGAYSDQAQPGEGIRIRFGHKQLKSGLTCIAALAPDFKAYSQGHLERWRPYLLDPDKISPLPDPLFEPWAARHLFGSWDVENSLIERIQEHVQPINALCSEVFGLGLFKTGASPHLHVPIAESDHAYQNSHQELYAYLLDGLERSTIDQIFPISGAVAPKGENATRKRLQAALPNMSTSGLWPILTRVSQQRSLATHNVHPSACPFAAFKTFADDLAEVEAGLCDLELELERVTGANSVAAQSRINSLKSFPEIDRPMVNAFGVTDVHAMVNRTVASVEYGLRRDNEDSNRSDVLIIHFTDGSKIGLVTDSNAGNVSTEHGDFPLNEFDTNFYAKFVGPPLRP